MNRVEMVTTAEFVHGTDTDIHLDDTSLAGTSGWIHVGRAMDEHWALYRFGSNAANVLGSLTPCTLGKVESDAAYTFPVGTEVFVVFSAEHLAEFIPVDTGKVTLSGGSGGSGDFRMQLVQIEGEGEAADTLDTISLPALGKILFLCAFNAAHAITVSEAGNFYLGGAAVVLNSTTHYEMFVGIGTKWCFVGRAGAVIGPASATDGAPVGFDGTSGKKAKELTAAALSAYLGMFTTASVTLYVDKAGDDGNAGTAGSPKLTITGALNALPSTIAHASYINVGAGTYTESLTTPLSRLNVLASLTIRAVNTSDVALHVRGAAAAGAGTTVDVEDAHVTADDQWNGGQIIIWQDTGSGQIRDITDCAAANNRLTVATWETNPASGSDYILTGLVVIDGNTASALGTSGCRNVLFEGIRFTCSGTDAVNCVDISGFSYLTFTDCLFDDIYAFSCGVSSSAVLWYCGFRIPASGYGLTVQTGSFVTVTGCVVYGAKSGDFGAYTASGGTLNVASLQVRHCATGVRAASGGWQLGSYITYTDNTTNTNPDAPATTADIVADGFAFIQDQS